MTAFERAADDRKRTRNATDGEIHRSGGRGNYSRRKDELLAVLREMRGKGFRAVSARGIARYLNNRLDPRRIGVVMSSLAAEGYVERIGEESPFEYTLRDEYCE